VNGTVRAAREAVVVGIPIDCTGAHGTADAPFGTELAPSALRSAGLVAAVAAADDGNLGVRIVGRDRDPATGVLGWPSVAGVTSEVRARTRDLAEAGKLPVLVGGCCTLLPGALAGARDALEPAGPVGLAYLDGHLDLYDGQTSLTGEAADMPIAAIAGHGPAPWSAQIGAPLVPLARLVLLGPRDREEATALRSVLPEDLGIGTELTPADIRSQGAAEVGQHTHDQLSDTGGRYWVHLDVDVLDEHDFPATDYLMPGGLTLAELTSLLMPLTRLAGIAGFSLAGYNPQKDPGGHSAQALTGLLGAILG
jgi:arginase